MRRLTTLALLAAVACGGTPKHTTAAGVDAREPAARPGAGGIEGVISGADGKAVSLANVFVVAPDATEPLADSISDGSGRFAITNIEPGTYRVIATHSSLRSEAHGVVVLPDEATSLNLRLVPDTTKDMQSQEAIAGRTGRIAGVVFDRSSNEPLGGATIEVTGGGLRESIFTLADAKGAFSVPGLAPATYVVSIYYSLIDKGNVEVRRSGVAVKAGVETKLRLEVDTETRD